ncbi:sulfite exporter TauE/SafE family protein [soil metagenome]
MEFSLILSMAIVLFAGAISGLSAFGFGLVSVPLLLLLYDPPTVTAVAILLASVTRWVVLWNSWRQISWRPVVLMLPTALAGSVIGILMIRELDTVYIELVASSVVIISAAMLMAGWRIPGAESPVAAPVAGLISGALSTSTGMGGPPVVLLFSARGYSAQVFRGSMTMIFYILGAISLMMLTREELIGRSDLRTALALVPAAVLGTWLGQRALHRFTAGQFNRIVLILLMATGLVGLTVALWHLIR